ncbi:MAG: hypothetical protein QNJ31_04875 [Candidatus Caenarcaniphilales bacterium]|nr:hypothetical protein [Candidatus Caenarcaniphilales bacterium]
MVRSAALPVKPPAVTTEPEILMTAGAAIIDATTAPVTAAVFLVVLATIAPVFAP